MYVSSSRVISSMYRMQAGIACRYAYLIHARFLLQENAKNAEPAVFSLKPVDRRRSSLAIPGPQEGGLGYQGSIRSRSPVKMTKYVECWGADKPFANITESTLAKNIGLAVSPIMIRMKTISIGQQLIENAKLTGFCDSLLC